MPLPGAPALRDKLPRRVRPAARRVYNGLWSGIAPRLNDREYWRWRYATQFGRLPRLDHPRTFNEKVLWRILFDRRPFLRIAADKVAVRDYIAGQVGPDYLVETYGVYGAFEDVPWASFPASYVVKASHGCGWVEVIDGTDPALAGPTMRSWLDTDYYDVAREPVYHHLLRRLIVERFIGTSGQSPPDYKVFCFAGVPRLIKTVYGRQTTITQRFYDTDWHALSVKQGYPLAPVEARPPALEEMLDVARRLSAEFDFVRVDLYHVDGRTYCGELTLNPNGGLLPFTPAAWDVTFGAWWRLPDGEQILTPGH